MPFKLNYYKPVSRILFLKYTRWLSFILPQHYCCDLAAYPSASGEQPSNADIRGITVHKVYPKVLLPIPFVSSYLTFSPLHPFLLSSYEESWAEVIFCGTFCFRSFDKLRSRNPAVNRCVALYCPDFPPHPINNLRIKR